MMALALMMAMATWAQTKIVVLSAWPTGERWGGLAE